MTKLEAMYTDIMLQLLKFIIILDRLRDQSHICHVIKSSLSLHKTNSTYPHIPSILT